MDVFADPAMMLPVISLEFYMLVQKLRLQRGWSQQQLADLSGLSVRTIQRIENGQAASVETMKSLASVFEIDFKQLQPEPEMNSSSHDPADVSSDSTSAPKPGTNYEEVLAMRHVANLKDFYLRVMTYVLIMGFLTVVNYMTSPMYWWVIWAALGWGLALLLRAVKVFGLVPFLGADWEKKQIERRLGKPLK
ncbi:MAG TPA: 2TM domain-containing protein [Steroidobacteraceae bacterium]|nr:2TM domain-containing protein [Steroidobacteraceae bacterium]